jgi:prolyl-tRNA editing enzyme YbaK/EbsC (Cys-tRNA(Pro) deacylase)
LNFFNSITNDKIGQRQFLISVIIQNIHRGHMTNETQLHTSAEKVQIALRKLGLPLKVVELKDTTRSAKEAAQAIGCQVEQIAKSLIFKTKISSTPILVIASGPNRVNESIISQMTGEEIEKADADFVLEQTGFVIGGVPPLGHKQMLKTYIDRDLLQYEYIWAAAGTPHAVFKLTPTDLCRITNGQVISIK